MSFAHHRMTLPPLPSRFNMLLNLEIKKCFTEKYQHMHTSFAEKESLRSALYGWMLKKDSLKLVEMLNIKSRFETCFKEAMKTSGQVEEKVGSYDEYIHAGLRSLSFEPDYQYPFMTRIYVILMETPIPDSLERNTALHTMQNWIQTSCLLENNFDQDYLNKFYVMNHQYRYLVMLEKELHLKSRKGPPSLNRYAPLLMTYMRSGKAADEISLLSVKCHDYFATFMNPMPSQRQKGKSFEETFFDEWQVAFDDSDREHINSLYAKLMQYRAKPGSYLTDDKLAKWEVQSIEYVTPYEINQFFLHAILVKPASWTLLFAKTLIEVLDVVEMKDTDNYNDNLKEQMYYLVKVYQGEEKAERPDSMILLPESVETVEEWISLNFLLDNKDDFECLYESRLPQVESLFLRAIQFGFEGRDPLKIDLTDCAQLLSGMPCARRPAFLTKLRESGKLELLLKNTKVNQFGNEIVRMLPDKNRDELRIELFQGEVPKLCLTDGELQAIWRQALPTPVLGFLNGSKQQSNTLPATMATQAYEAIRKAEYAETIRERYDVLAMFVNDPANLNDRFRNALVNAFGLATFSETKLAPHQDNTPKIVK